MFYGLCSCHLPKEAEKPKDLSDFINDPNRGEVLEQLAKQANDDQRAKVQQSELKEWSSPKIELKTRGTLEPKEAEKVKDMRTNPRWIKGMTKKTGKDFTPKGEKPEAWEEELKELIMSYAFKKEQVNGFQPFGYADEEKEREIYFMGFDDGRSLLAIDLASHLKGTLLSKTTNLIRQTLQAEKDRIREKVENLKTGTTLEKKWHSDYMIAYNDALDDVIKKIL